VQRRPQLACLQGRQRGAAEARYLELSGLLTLAALIFPKVSERTDFNMWTWNSRVFPGIDPLVAGKGDRVRVRVVSLTMTNHPVHLHGYRFSVTRTDGGWVPETAAMARGDHRYPGRRHPRVRGCGRQSRRLAASLAQIAPHDRCDGSQHAELYRRGPESIDKKIRQLGPDYMPMGATGMADIGAMEMTLHDNTLPTMTGVAQFGPVEMAACSPFSKCEKGWA
jgi:manganese oxidase